MVNDKKKDNKKLMKRPVPVNMLVKRVFLLSAESSWNSSSFIWNPGCKKKGPLHKLTTSRRRSKLSIISLNTPEQTCPFLGHPLFTSNAFFNTEPLFNQNAPSDYLANMRRCHSAGLHTITLQVTEVDRKSRENKSHGIPLIFFFYFAKNTCVLGSQVRNALFYAWVCLASAVL